MILGNTDVLVSNLPLENVDLPREIQLLRFPCVETLSQRLVARIDLTGLDKLHTDIVGVTTAFGKAPFKQKTPLCHAEKSAAGCQSPSEIGR